MYSARILNTNILRMPFNGSDGRASGRMAPLLGHLRRSCMAVRPASGYRTSAGGVGPANSDSSSPPSRSILFDALWQALHGTRLACATAETLRLELLQIGVRHTRWAVGVTTRCRRFGGGIFLIEWEVDFDSRPASYASLGLAIRYTTPRSLRI